LNPQVLKSAKFTKHHFNVFASKYPWGLRRHKKLSVDFFCSQNKILTRKIDTQI